MKLFPIALVALVALMSGCSKEDIIPTPDVPVTPVQPRKLYFHCDKHNLSYRFNKYVQDEYKDFVMPCPVCETEKMTAFMSSNKFYEYQMLCPIDSTWSNFDSSSTHESNSKDFVSRKREPFFPIVPTLDSFKGISLSDLKVEALNKENKNYHICPDCWCDSCYSHARTLAIKQKQDSIVTYHAMINKIIGVDKQPYPINEGVPVDRRVRASQILDSIEAIMPKLDWFYKKEYNTLDRFVGSFNIAKQSYIYCKRTGTPMGSWVTRDVLLQTKKDEYIGDTVVITIGGGPDFQQGGGMTIPLYKAKASTKARTRSISSGFQRYGSPTITQAGVVNDTQLLDDFSPEKVDLFPDEYLPRRYNTPTTAFFGISHPQKGNELYSDNTMGWTWSYVDMAASVGGFDTKFPHNIVSVETAELINDIGVMQIRKVVEWCKARHKVMAIMGTSWGGAMIMRYLLYYPASDFDYIFIADQNPNIQKELVERDMEFWVYQAQTKYGMGTYKEINKNMCVLATSPYRRLNWLKKQNLSNTVFYYVDGDDTLGGIPTEDIATLKGLGAKVYQFPHSVAHGAFHKDNVWYRQIVPTRM